MTSFVPYSCTVPIGQRGAIQIAVQESHLGYRHDELFTMGLRHNNRKRSFLFVSHILGKHIPIRPHTLRRAGYVLASLYAKKRNWLPHTEWTPPLDLDFELNTQPRLPCPKKTLVIGFAETATAMGNCVFEAFGGDVAYVHTTREHVPNWKTVLFAEESHSHATEHFLYLHNEALLREAEEIIIVDDEMTTGSTARNLIEAVEKVSPGKTYGLLTFLDWRKNAKEDPFANLTLRGIDVYCASLLQGGFQLEDAAQTHEEALFGEGNGEIKSWQHHRLNLETITGDYLWSTGRFGFHATARTPLESELRQHGKQLKELRQGRTTLCLGTSECMYLPLRLAGYLGDEVYFHATTRSPALPIEEPNYAINSAIRFAAPDEPSRTEYLYNLGSNAYDEVFLFFERAPRQGGEKSLLRALEQYPFKHRHLIVLGS